MDDQELPVRIFRPWFVGYEEGNEIVPVALEDGPGLYSKLIADKYDCHITRELAQIELDRIWGDCTAGRCLCDGKPDEISRMCEGNKQYLRRLELYRLKTVTAVESKDNVAYLHEHRAARARSP